MSEFVTVDGRHVAVFRLGDEFFALDNMCLHRGGPLCDGSIENNIVTCPWHGWSRVRVSKHEIRIEGEVISVRLTDWC